MLDRFYQEQQRRRNRLNPMVKWALILSIMFFVYRMAPVVKYWWLWELKHI
jgi:hypothetical protein